MFRFSNQSIVPTKFVFGVGNFGILFDDVPTTGENGPSILLNDGGVSGDRVRALVTRWPINGTLLAYEDGSFDYQGTADSFDYDDYINGAVNNSNTVFLNEAAINISITDTLNSVTSSMDIGYTPQGSGITISDNLPSITTNMQVTSIVPEFNIGVTDTLSGITTTMGITNGIPNSNIGIVSTLSSIVSSVSIENVVPEYQIDIISSLNSVQTLMGVSYIDPNRSIGIADNLSPITTTIGITNVVPEINFSIVDALNSVSTIMSVVNGELITHVAEQNKIYLKSKSRKIFLR